MAKYGEKISTWRKEIEAWLDTTGVEFGYRLPRPVPVRVSVKDLGVRPVRRPRLSFFPG